MSKASYQNYASADDFITTKSTINKSDDIYVSNISDPNVLFPFASYNALFTLSGLSQKELENTTTLLNSKPHDIIVRSAGIGPTENQPSNLGPDQFRGFSADDKELLQKNERLRGAIDKSKRVLSANRDLFIRSVTMNSVPGLNEKRRLTSVTQIQMEIVEPAGITLLERVRGAAINNGFLDHLDAPFMLTIDFQGFDENGNTINSKETMRRVIPVKIVDMQLDVNQGGTVYSVKAIPYNEFAYVNQYNYPRTSGTLSPAGKRLSDVFVALETLLNKQNEDEKEEEQVEKPDIYTITFDNNSTDGIKDLALTFDSMDQTGMAAQGVTGSDGGFYVGTGQEVPPDYMRINTNNSIIKILEEIMKGHPEYTDKKFEQFKQKASRELSKAQFNGGAQEVLEQAEEFYFPYFKIRSSVVPIEGEFDSIRGTQRKKVNFHVEPYKIHAYSLAIPGVSTGVNFKSFVFKTYNYIFTGENVDILDLDINYKVAYFQSRLKDFEATDKRKNKIEKVSGKKTGSTSANTHFADQPFHLRSVPSNAKSEGTGKTGGTPTQLDAFLDSLTHPLADMVNIRMEILGDPAWISQSQFIPLNASKFTQGTGRGSDPDISYWRANRGRIWNDKLRCYNTDVAEPIIMLNFRMPTDIDDQKGIYELQSNQSAAFSGLYRVVMVEHNFTDGRYTNVLQLTRFNNQGVIISDPVPNTALTTIDGTTFVLPAINAKKILLSKNPFSKIQSDLTSIGKKFVDLTNKIKGFLS